MFEDALMESGGKIKTKSKYWSIVTLILNGAILAGLAIWPLLHPEALPNNLMVALLVAPSPPPPPPPPPPPAAPKVQVHSELMNNELQAPSKIPHVIKQVTESAPPSMGVAGMEGMSGGSGNGVPGGLFGAVGTGPVVKAPPPQKMKISSGVMNGNLLQKITPRYPEIARQARISGTVVLQATISKTGQIINLKVVSGPAMLQQAALEAVQQWRYRPYELNGEPVEVETTVNVVFNLGD
jgi:periplasmic protein TonB